MDDKPNVLDMTGVEIREWLDEPSNLARAFESGGRWRRGESIGVILNYPPGDDDVEIPVTLAPDQLVKIDEICRQLEDSGHDEPGYGDRSSIVRAAVAWYLMMADRGRKARGDIDGPAVAVPLRYGTPDNSGSVVLRGVANERTDSAAGVTPVMLPYELAAKLSRRRWRYLVVEEEVIDHLRDTGQRVPEAPGAER